MSKNPYKGIDGRSTNKEWGRQARKEETRLRGLKHRAERDNIDEQVEDILSEKDDD